MIKTEEEEFVSEEGEEQVEEGEEQVEEGEEQVEEGEEQAEEWAKEDKKQSKEEQAKEGEEKDVCLPPYSPFLNPIEEFFSSWRWKVYDRQPYTRENLLRAMDLACDDVAVEAFQGWVWHARAFFPRCLAMDNIACDVDEVLWPDPARRDDAP
ncbi:coiled-coil domain-containing glutamate-rich protein 1-like [Cololabis saira]|uniref:coiled-coil domain-containing glutamate-rich protein 1-like n=1 Tax=Cololabis saira TaxID=129043 RepID=UPI002AD2E114|nr:coiled-coil domain-containing glutamate-rich protein 1-like [Cololabis saira]